MLNSDVGRGPVCAGLASKDNIQPSKQSVILVPR
jgi:hypothetical protein